MTDIIVTEAQRIKEAAEYIIQLRSGIDPDPPEPSPEPPTPPGLLYATDERIGMVVIAGRNAPIRVPYTWGETSGLKPIPKINQVEMMRDNPPVGKSANPARDRYILPAGEIAYVYCPSNTNYRKSNGRYSVPGPGGMNLWELVPTQPCLEGKVLLPNDKQHKRTKLEYVQGIVKRRKVYVPVFLCVTRIPEIVPKDQRAMLKFWR